MAKDLTVKELEELQYTASKPVKFVKKNLSDKSIVKKIVKKKIAKKKSK